jgi:hypothetical protein
MRQRFEFTLYPIAASDVAGGVDPSLALLGSLGWELRGITSDAAGGLVLALQRPLDEELPLPDAPTLAATLVEPLSVPSLTTERFE